MGPHLRNVAGMGQLSGCQQPSLLGCSYRKSSGLSPDAMRATSAFPVAMSTPVLLTYVWIASSPLPLRSSATTSSSTSLGGSSGCGAGSAGADFGAEGVASAGSL